MRLFLLFSFFFLAVSAIDPKDIANRQLTATYNALKSGNQEELFKLLFTSEEDKKHFPEFSKRIQGVSVTLESAMSLPDGNIEAILKVNGIHPAKMVLKQNPVSPTGYSIIGIGRMDTSSRHVASWWTMCYIGYFWCAMEFLLVWAVGY